VFFPSRIVSFFGFFLNLLFQTPIFYNAPLVFHPVSLDFIWFVEERSRSSSFRPPLPSRTTSRKAPFTFPKHPSLPSLESESAGPGWRPLYSKAQSGFACRDHDADSSFPLIPPLHQFPEHDFFASNALCPIFASLIYSKTSFKSDESLFSPVETGFCAASAPICLYVHLFPPLLEYVTDLLYFSAHSSTE